MGKVHTSVRTKSRVKSQVTPIELMSAILDEIQKLRSDMMTLIPTERLDDYVHPNRIRHSYQKALKRYPPQGV